MGDEERTEREANEAALRVAREALSALRTAVWDGTGFTLDELPDDWRDTVRWRDTGMTLEVIEEFLLSEAEPPSFRRRKR